MKRSRRVLCLAGIILLLITAALLAWRFLPKPEPAYTPPARDPLAQAAVDWPENLPVLSTDIYDVSLNPDLRVDATGACPLWLKNPAYNSAYLMADIRLKDSGLLIYRTGLVAPGEGVCQIAFVKDALNAMAAGAQPVILTVYSFALDTYLSMGEINLETLLTYEPEENV